MAKPTIVTRAGKGSALTWTEGDANLTNLKDATVSIKAGSAGVSVSADLNSEIVLVAGTNITLTGDNTAKTITIAASGGGATTLDGLTDVVITAAATNDVLVYNGTDWVDTAASSLTVSAASTATTATGATNINISTTTGNTADTVMFPVLVGALATGNQLPHIDNDLSYNASTNALTATTFVGALTGNADTATTATGATNINISTTDGNSNDTTLYPVFVSAASTGNQLPHTDAGIAYNASTNALTLGQNGVALGSIIFANSTAGGSTTLSVPANAGTFTFTLPSSNGNTQNLLTTNGAGLTSWASSITGTFTFNNGVANNPKLTIGTGTLSSTAWTTTGIGLRVSAATYTDTSSTAGTVAASHVHAIAASTLEASNTITITDSASLYVAAAPIAGTRTTITNGWAILAGGRIKASAVDATPIGSTTASTGAFTTLTATGAVTLSPASLAVAISPTGTGTVAISPAGALTINPTTASTINNTSIGVTTAAAGR